MTTKTWAATVAAAGGTWSDATHWVPSAPVAGDQIVIGSTTQTSTIAVTEDVTLTVASVSMASNTKGGQNSTTLTVTQPFALTVSGQIVLDTKSTITGIGTLVANSLISGTGTIIAGPGLLDIMGTGAIASGVVLGFNPSTTSASTLKLDQSGVVSSAQNIAL